MKKVLMAAAAVACFGTVAMAGPNDGGTLIVSTNGELWTSDIDSYCGASGVGECEQATASIDGAATEAVVLHVLAAFAPSANPRLAGLTFGIAYDANEVFFSALGGCGDFELPTDGWPAPGEGTAITWNAAQTGQVNDVYWIAAYNYYSNPQTLDLIPHPTQGAFFADDSIPAEVDPIAGLSSFGFDTEGNIICPDAGQVPGACCDLDTGECTITQRADCADPLEFQGEGTVCDPNPCPQPEVGACCAEDGSCSIRTEAECDDLDGDYLGDGTECTPDACVIPVVPTSWGEIKSNYR